MKRFTALTLAVTWMFAIAAPPVATAAEVPVPLVAEECVASDAAMDTCQSHHTKHHPDGSISICPLQGTPTPFLVHHPDGSVSVGLECNYGTICGTIRTR